jgi:hypothetical protein
VKYPLVGGLDRPTFVHAIGCAALACVAFQVALSGWAAAAETGATQRASLPKIVARASNGHGLLCTMQGKVFLLVSGSPEQMGAAHGQLLKQDVQQLMDRVLYTVGGATTLYSGQWFLDTMAEIERRTTPYTPDRFLRECDALSEAAGVSKRDGRYGNFFPEQFHCSGIAVRGKATQGGRVLHARVLDYMRDIGIQNRAVVIVYMPEGYNAWISQSYSGFVGTVTCMNAKGLAIGEIGGEGQGKWDGMPMTFLLRELMERTASVDEALDLMKKTPRTCKYHYVLSDKSGNLAAVVATPEKVECLKAGEQHPMLPHIPDDTVLISAPGRAQHAVERIEKHYGKIGVPEMIEIIKRPVAMNSNLHDAIFAPETLDMWFADAGRRTVACDEPYAKCNLGELISFYEKASVGTRAAAK